MKIGPINFSIKSVLPPVIYDSIKKPITPPQKFVSKEIGSFSQYNEDLLVDVLLNCKKNGFYVDVGANNPSILSNTKRFYDRGWKGINIEPNPELYKEFVLERKRDVNLNIGVGNSSDKLPFYVMSANTLSSFDKTCPTDDKNHCKDFPESLIRKSESVSQWHPRITTRSL